jgi:hypothetical protein
MLLGVRRGIGWLSVTPPKRIVAGKKPLNPVVWLGYSENSFHET